MITEGKWTSASFGMQAGSNDLVSALTERSRFDCRVPPSLINRGK